MPLSPCPRGQFGPAGMTVPAGKPARASLSFSVEGLSARDELLVKSLVRLLGHRTHQQWNFQSDPAQAALHLCDADIAAATAAVALQSAVPVLVVGRTDPGQGPFLRLPPHADEFEQLLNRLGAQILQAHATTTPVQAERTEPASAIVPAPEPLNDRSFRLVRWPPAALLGAPWRTKLATLMVGQALPLDVLHQRSGVALADCTGFVRELQQAGLVREAGAAGSPTAGQTPALALATAFTAAPVVAATANGADLLSIPFPLPTPPKAQPGLLARIRARLGLHPGL